MLRYWQESNIVADWLKPDQSSSVTVETTAYVLLTVLLKVMSLPGTEVQFFVVVHAKVGQVRPRPYLLPEPCF